MRGEWDKGVGGAENAGLGLGGGGAARERM